MPTPNIQILLTGDELMTGDINDSNSAMVASHLKPLGLTLNKKVTIGDNLEDLVNEINLLSTAADILIINGGLGPTSDDLTSEAMARAANCNLAYHIEALTHINNWCQRRNLTLSPQNKKQAYLPQGCDIIANKNGSAVGIKMRINHCDIYATPGVPHELETMLEEEIMPAFSSQFPQSSKTIRLQTYGLGEAVIQGLIDENLTGWPDELTIGYRAAMPFVEVKLTYSPKDEALKTMWLTKIQQLFGDHIITRVNEKSVPLAEFVLTQLKQKNLSICTAESCTGGLIASQITAISGSSAAFEAGYVTYSNDIKQKTLAVSKQTLEQHGAVSQQTVEAMLTGALKASGADLGIAVSGIAGPSGGTQEKPVGSVWIAWGSLDNLHSHYFCIPNTRVNFQHSVAARSLDLIRRILIGSAEKPFYLK